MRTRTVEHRAEYAGRDVDRRQIPVRRPFALTLRAMYRLALVIALLTAVACEETTRIIGTTSSPAPTVSAARTSTAAATSPTPTRTASTAPTTAAPSATQSTPK